jgi:hypothetical protein
VKDVCLATQFKLLLHHLSLPLTFSLPNSLSIMVKVHLIGICRRRSRAASNAVLSADVRVLHWVAFMERVEWEKF